MSNCKNFFLAAMAWLLVGGSVHAAEIEEIVVTAQKRSESLQDVPVAVAALSAQDMANQGITGPQGLQVAIPGLVYNNTGATAQPFLRGVGTRLAQNGLELSIATYMDDRYVARPTASMFEFADVERIEVLKGPQGTLYGRNSTGGAIRVISMDVEDEFSGSVRGSAGNYSAYTVSGTVNIPISDVFGVRLTGLTKSRDGFADNVDPRGRDEWDDVDYQAFRGKARWDMSDTATARLSIDYWDRDDLAGVENVNISPGNLGTGNFLAAANGTPITLREGKLASAMTDTNEGNELSGQLRFDLSFEAVDFASITTFNDFELDWIGDADGGGGRHLDAFVFEESDGWSQEFQFVSNSDTGFQWLAGFFYFSDEHDYELTVDFSDVVPGFIFSQSAQSVEVESWSVYGQVSWPLTDATTLTLGGRYTDDEKDVEAVASTREGVTLGSVVPTSLSDSWGEFTPSVTLDHIFNEEVMGYFTYSRGFKSGGYNYPVLPTADAGPLDPEILDMFELGLKAELLDGSMRLNASAYYYDYEDLQVTRAAGGAGAAVTTENAADAKVLGLDLDMVWRATDMLSLTAGISLLDTEYENYEASAFVFRIPGNTATAFGEAGMGRVAFDADGEDLIRAPDFSFAVSAEYMVPLDNASLPIYIGYSYKSEYDFDFVAGPRESLLTQDAYGIWNARVSYEPSSEQWSISAWGYNLSDEDYYDDNVANGAGIRVNRGAPRTYGVDFTFNF